MGLLAVGGLTFAWALLFDWIRQRFVRRRRCPKCWYDLSHNPGLRCSECGYEAKRERTLLKAKRRWGVAALGMLLLVGSYAAFVTPAVQDRGWPAAVPTTVLIVSLPCLEARNPTWPKHDDPARERLFNDLYGRHFGSGSTLWQWQQRWLLRRAVRTTKWTGRRQDMDAPGAIVSRALDVAMFDSQRLPIPLDEITIPLLDRHSASLVHVPERWPADEPLRIRTLPTSLIHWRHHTLRISPVHGTDDQVLPVYIPWRVPPEFDLRSSPSGWRTWRDRTYPIFNQPIPHANLQLKLELLDDASTPAKLDARILWSTVQELNIVWVDDIHDIVTPVESDEISSIIYSQIRMESRHPFWNRSRPRMHIPIPAMSGPNAGVILALTIELYREGESMLFGHFNTRTEESDVKLEIDFIGKLEVFGESGINPDEWTVIVRGDPRIAIRDFTEGRYWSGEISIPLSTVFAR